MNGIERPDEGVSQAPPSDLAATPSLREDALAVHEHIQGHKPLVLDHLPPGETIREVLYEYRCSQVMLAEECGISTKHLNQIIQGKVTYSAALALKFEAALGVPAEFWMRLQAQWLVARERQRVAA